MPMKPVKVALLAGSATNAMMVYAPVPMPAAPRPAMAEAKQRVSPWHALFVDLIRTTAKNEDRRRGSDSAEKTTDFENNNRHYENQLERRVFVGFAP